MTSRPVPRIEGILKGLSVPQIALDQDLVDQDVANLQASTGQVDVARDRTIGSPASPDDQVPGPLSLHQANDGQSY